MRSLSCVIFILLISAFSFAQSPHGDNLKNDCADCHEPADWKIIHKEIKFDHNKETNFNLTGQHSSVSCESCHKSLVFSDVKNECMSCHKDVHQNTLGPDCARCHTTSAWVVTNIIQIHQNSRFPLVGIHMNVDCTSCHSGYAKLFFPPQDVSCFNCHKQQYYTAKNPDHVAAKFSTDCQDCHSITSSVWASARFDHSFFPLTGGHNIQNCFSCHSSSGSFKGLSTACYSCHANTYNTATSPANHTAAGLPHTCQDCHNISTWNATTFNHTATGFTLTGAHVTLDCSSCHKGTVTGLTTDCYPCHSKDFTATTDPNHVAQGFPHDCSQCHSTTSWSGATFDHNTTAFPLTGAHATVQCAQCHTSGYTNTPTLCYSCHTSTYNSATSPANHPASGLPRTCQDCHNTTTWTATTFNHTTTGFTLTGAHLTIDCSSCHKGTVTGLTTDCYLCHSKEFAGTTDPNHVAQGFPHDCTQCHSTTNWSRATFDHSRTGFPLTGAHASVQCAQCHTTGYTSTPTDCYSCHTNTYNTAIAPTNHLAAGLPHTCQDCHNTTAWTATTFNHTTTGFTLTGAHTTLDCSLCHKGTVTGLTPDCYSCHAKDFSSTTDPNHVTQGFPHDCTQCHSTTSWSGATFNHSTTGFPLTGAHVSVQCAQCHASGYTSTSTACYSCHQANYQTASNPNHSALALPTDCSTCHTTNPGWTNATFPIHSNYYQLVGAHISLTCDNCHNGNYNTAPTTCYGCHQNNYNTTTNPAHKTAGFPTDCTQCHTQSVWQPSTFNHDAAYFPIYSGTHVGRWTLCSDCHSTASNFAVFSCITCHEHSQANTDPHHTGVRNYVYSATSCYTCHPTGRSD